MNQEVKRVCKKEKEGNRRDIKIEKENLGTKE